MVRLLHLWKLKKMVQLQTKESDNDEASEIDDAEVEGDKGPAFGWGTAAKEKV